MSEYIVDTFGIVQEFADLHGDMSTPLYRAIMDVVVSRQREEIVRCRDCEYTFSSDLFGDTRKRYCRWFCHDIYTEDGFCAWGKRRGDEDDA